MTRAIVYNNNLMRKRKKSGYDYQMKSGLENGTLVKCPLCGKGVKPGSNKPHHLPKPNNFLQCEWKPSNEN